MLWPVTAALGDAPTAIIACVTLVLGVVLAARGRRGEPPVESAAPPEAQERTAPAPAAPLAAAEPPAPAVGHGAIRFVTHDEAQATPAPEPVVAEPEPEPVAAEPEPVAAEPEPEPVEPEPEPEPPQPPPAPAVPQAPPTTFRHGTIRVGGLERRRD